MIYRILSIVSKDIQVEWRQKHALAGIVLFAVIVVFIVYKSFNKLSGLEWALLLWIITLFAGINAIVKSFLQESKGTYLYYYTLLDPIELLIARLIYNFLLLSILFILITFLMIVFGGNPIKDWPLFIYGSSLGVLGISGVFTVVASMATAGGNNSTLMSILALPCVLPILLLLNRTTAVSLRLIQDSDIGTDLLLLGGIDGLLIGLSIFLFPQIWKA